MSVIMVMIVLTLMIVVTVMIVMLVMVVMIVMIVVAVVICDGCDDLKINPSSHGSLSAVTSCGVRLRVALSGFVLLCLLASQPTPAAR